MPRIVEVTVPSDQTDQFVAMLRGRDEVLGMQLQRGASLKPPGDVITISTTNRSIHALVQLLDAHGIGASASTSLATSEPVSLVVPPARTRLNHDTSEGTWEEIETVLGKESNATGNTLGIMVISGILAAIGLATNALHLVIAAMLVAPGFEPLLRISLGIVVRSLAWRRGVVQTAKVYGALLLGALIGSVILRLVGTSPLGDDAGYLPEEVLVDYWTAFTLPALLVSLVASAVGAILVAANRAVLTAGVMVALALVPGATLAVSGLMAGDAGIAGRGALRWLLDAVLVVGVSAVVFAWKQARVHRRHSHL